MNETAGEGPGNTPDAADPSAARDTSRRGGLFSGLAFRIASHLAIALLPIGAIAIFQAVQIMRDESRRVESALLTATAEAATGEALAIAGATGAAQVLAAHVADTPGATSGPGCSGIFAATVDAVPQFSFAGYVDADGILQCGPSNIGRDLSTGAVYPVMARDPAPVVVTNRQGPMSGTSVIIAAAPVMIDATYAGFVSISIPHQRIRDVIHRVPGDGAPERVVKFVTFNADGAVLSAGEEADSFDEILPAGRSLQSLVGQGQRSFTGVNQAGARQSFAVVPVIPGVIYALGSWDARRMGWDWIAPVLFPALMLIVGLGAAFYAVDRQVIRRIREHGRQMRTFSQTRRFLPPENPRRLPREFAEIQDSWQTVADHLLRDEAELANIVHEKNVLLKEIHHRVKNNLQLIASIINLKIRRAKSPEARRTLGEVRMRVQSIAHVHQALYSSPTGASVRADDLLADVIDATIEGGLRSDRPVEIHRHFDPVPLYPDQAVPFLLLATEAVTNALKYIGEPAGGAATIDITLRAPNPDAGEDKAVFRVANSLGKPFFPVEQVQGSGLGRSLLKGFATQIGGAIQIDETEDAYDFRVSFAPAEFDPETELLALGGEVADEAAGEGG